MRTGCALIAYICLMTAANPTYEILCFVKSKQDLIFILLFILRKKLSASRATLIL